MRNNVWFDFSVLCLNTASESAEESILAAYPNDEQSKEFKKLAGLFLATRSLTESLTGESTELMTVEVDTIRENSVVAKIFDR